MVFIKKNDVRPAIKVRRELAGKPKMKLVSLKAIPHANRNDCGASWKSSRLLLPQKPARSPSPPESPSIRFRKTEARIIGAGKMHTLFEFSCNTTKKTTTSAKKVTTITHFISVAEIANRSCTSCHVSGDNRRRPAYSRLREQAVAKIKNQI
jgi:hypothetical protein